MEKLSRLARMLQPTLLGVALLLGGLGYYYYRYLPAREAAQTDRLFRQLDEMSDQVVRKLDILANCLQTAAAAALEGPTLSRDEVPANAWQTFRTGAGAFVPRLEISPDFLVEVNVTGETNRSFALGVERQGALIPLVCSLTWTTNDLRLSARITTDFKRLVEPIVSRHEFQDLLMVDGRGRVLSQLGSGLPQLDSLPNLLPGPRRGSAQTDTNVLSLSKLGTATRAVTDLAGRRCLVFVVPLSLRLTTHPAGTDPDRWYLAGVIEEREHEARARPLPYFVVFGFIAAVVLLAILLPFLNILTGGSHSTIQSQQVVFLICATLTGSCGLVIVSTQVAEHWHQEDQLDRELESLSGQITTAFQTEIQGTVHWLGSLTLEALRKADLDRTNRLTDLGASRLRIQRGGTGSVVQAPQSLRLVQWIQTNGMQAVKWSTASSMTPMIQVGDREYVRGILSGRGHPDGMSAREYGVDHRFVVVPLHSRLRAENVLACSIAAPVDRLAGRTGLAVVCAEFEPVSVMRTLVPAGFHFAVVGPEGEVLFHSDDRRNLRENLLIECDRDARLGSAIRSRRIDSFFADYNQDRHRMRTSPIPGLPWTLVAMREHRILDSVRAAQTTALAALLAAAGLVVGAILWSATAIRRITSGGSAGLPRWFWPNQACLPAYRISSVVHAAVLSGAVVLVLTQFPLSRHPAIFGLLYLLGPGCAALSCVWLWRRTRQRPDGEQTLVTGPEQRAYIAWLATALAALVLPSALTVHRVIAEIESERFVRWTAAALSDALKVRVQNATDPQSIGPTQGPGLYPSVFQDTSFRWTQTPPSPWIPDADSFFLPLLQSVRRDFQNPSMAGARIHDWGGGAADDGSWSSARIGDRLEFHRRVWHATGGAGTLIINSALLTFPTLNRDSPWVIVTLLGILLGVLATWFAAQFIATRVLLLRLAPDDSTPLPSLLVACCEPPIDGWFASRTHSHEGIRTFLRNEESRLCWHADPHAGVGPTPRESVQVWDWRGQTGVPGPELIAHWHRLAGSGDCQVIILTHAANAAQTGSSMGRASRCHWTLPAGGNITRAVLAALTDEYERRWGSCTAAEQRALWEVARTGFEDAANPAVAHLLRSGWLRLDPKLRVPGGGWRRFILAAASLQPPPATTDVPDNSWRVIRTLLVVAALGIMAFLMLTQPDTWQRTTGVIAGLLAGFKLMGDFLGTFRKEATGSDDKS